MVVAGFSTVATRRVCPAHKRDHQRSDIELQVKDGHPTVGAPPPWLDPTASPSYSAIHSCIKGPHWRLQPTSDDPPLATWLAWAEAVADGPAAAEPAATSWPGKSSAPANTIPMIERFM